MSTCALHLTRGTVINASITSLREDGVVAIVQEQAVGDAFTPAHKPLRFNLKRDVLVSFHQEEFLVFRGQEFLCLLIERVLRRGCGKVEG